MATHHPKYGNHPSKGLPSTIPGWLPTISRMVPHHPKDGPPPSAGRSPTLPRLVNHNPEDGHPPYQGWSTTIPLTDTYHPQDGHKNIYPSSQEWSPTFLWMLSKHTQSVIHPQDNHLLFQEWSTTIPRTATHHPQDGQPHPKYDTKNPRTVITITRTVT